MHWRECNQSSTSTHGRAWGRTANRAITIQFHDDEKRVSIHGTQEGLPDIFDFECYWNSPSDLNARKPLEKTYLAPIRGVIWLHRKK
ncbi:hypothetical protein PGTUg99_035086 [Puccinia graminis f. sp. tritici]|uniref:Uncharacterized protein n=1 Tax=Puccinia graminis f. sp. tritici TaxID=56615 RepID=A0A5B0SPX0_PUCGR|nr:hypothetical protein PGTUg99_035086 [Puccinia graminis f. sp. tritici]